MTIPSPINAGLTLGFWTFGLTAHVLHTVGNWAGVVAGYCIIRRCGMSLAQARAVLTEIEREAAEFARDTGKNSKENGSDQE